jgi:hypothetical protein
VKGGAMWSGAGFKFRIAEWGQRLIRFGGATLTTPTGDGEISGTDLGPHRRDRPKGSDFELKGMRLILATLRLSAFSSLTN